MAGLPWLSSTIWGPMLGGLITGMQHFSFKGEVWNLFALPSTHPTRKSMIGSYLSRMASFGMPAENVGAALAKQGIVEELPDLMSAYGEKLNYSGASQVFGQLSKDVLLTPDVLAGTGWEFPERMSREFTEKYFHHVEVVWLDDEGNAWDQLYTIRTDQILTADQVEESAWIDAMKGNISVSAEHLYGEGEPVQVKYVGTYHHTFEQW